MRLLRLAQLLKCSFFTHVNVTINTTVRKILYYNSGTRMEYGVSNV